jgi:hypothetical protein
MALVNQKMGERQGNANYILYKLAAQQPTAFHDVPTGSTIAMPCVTGSLNCTTKTAGDSYGVLSGYSTTTGYDQATGLGSVDANNLVTKWNLVTLAPSVTTLSSLTPTTLTHGQAVNFSASVKPQTGTGTPSGQISLMGGTSGTQPVAAFVLSGGSASGSTEMLPGGSYSVVAHYPGDATYGASDSGPISVTVNPENSLPLVLLETFDWNGYLLNGNASTAVYGSPYLLRVNVENAAGKVCVPVATSGTTATACPTGTVALTNNGSPLDAGTYSLNSYGYFEDTTVQLPGGSNTIGAAYSGDSSFKAGSAPSTTLTVTPAPTTISQTGVGADGTVGYQLTVNTQVQSNSSGAPPTGTVTFYSNGTPMVGTVSYNGFTTGGTYPQAFLNATFASTTSPFTAPGTYTITAQYKGDANYAPSAVSVRSQVAVKYPSPNVVVTPYSQTVNYGGTASIAVLVDTTNKSVYPTGTVTFSGTSAGAVACANATDTSGNFACQAAASFNVTSGGSILIQYSGDANYPASSNWAYISMPDFIILPQGGVQVTAGQSQDVPITIQSQNGLSGTVASFGCSDLPAETTCTFNPTQLTLSSDGSVSTTVTVSTTAIGQSRKHVGSLTKNWGSNGGVMLLLGMCFLGIPLSRRRGRFALALALLFVVLPSCGGGSGGGGGGTPNPVPSITSLSPTQVAAGSQIQSLYVNGSNFMTSSTVTYNGTLHNSSLQSPTQIQVALGPDDVATTGPHAVVVSNPSPGGGPSTPVNFNVVTGTPTGVFYLTLTATSGPITHTTTMIMYVQ